ncbi:MAG: hypothetical protein CBC84_001200 [Pelagibacteraceae bacterium TMED124]|nr:MAG: hypothetical protein CBC84_001200 [Pelagibacteraceae bacterium TMED124]|tara:strand:- start:49 stop:1068 length:1020 start_codon:yes stop_codon:yes gene_type:complete
MRPILKNNEVDFSALINFIFNHNKKALRISFIVVVIYIIYFFAIKTPKYSSSISFYTNYNKSNSSVLSAIPLSNFSIGGGENNLNFSINDFIKSDQFLNSVITQKYNLNGKEIYLTDLWGSDYNNYMTLNPFSLMKTIDMNLQFVNNLSTEEKERIYAKQKLLKKISFSEDRVSGLNVLGIVIRNNSELGAQILQNSYTSIISFYNQVTNTKAIEKRIFIEDRIQTVKENLETKEGELKIFLEKNKNFNSPKLLLEKARLDRQITLYSQVYLNLFNQLELAKIDEYDNTSTIFILDDPSKSIKKAGMGLFRGIGIVFLLSYLLVTLVFFIRRRKELIQL